MRGGIRPFSVSDFCVFIGVFSLVLTCKVGCYRTRFRQDASPVFLRILKIQKSHIFNKHS